MLSEIFKVMGTTGASLKFLDRTIADANKHHHIVHMTKYDKGDFKFTF